MIKWIVAVVIIVIAVAGLWWSGLLNTWINPGTPAATNEQATTTPEQQTQQPAAVNDLPTQIGDSSDSAIVQDAAAVDAQMKAYDSDSANVNQSFNDKPTAQEF